MASYNIFFAIKWIGAAYLIYLGLGAFFSRSSMMEVSHDAARTVADVGDRRLFLDGFVLQAANPKALVFFMALLPQFIDPRGSVAAQIVILGLTSVALEFAILAAYGALAGRATEIARQPRYVRLTNRIAGSMLIVAGLGIARLRKA